MPAPEPLTVAFVTIAALAAMARLRPAGRASAPLSRFAAWALLAAGGSVLASVAAPQAWTATVLHAAPLKDPRLIGSVALAIVSILSLLALSPKLAEAGTTTVSMVASGALGAAIAAAAVGFVGLRGGLPLTAVALGGAGFTLALVAIARFARTGGPWRAGLLASGASLVVIGTALACCGARAASVPIARGTVADTLGYSISYRGVQDAAVGRVALALEVTRGAWRLEAHPSLPRTAGPGGAHEAFASPFTGPVGILEGFDRSAAEHHPVVWLTKGDSVEVGDTSIRFIRFRVESGEAFHMFADLAVTHAGISDAVSPAVRATAHGEEPIPVAVAGVGSILIAGMDADHGRVALLIPGAAGQPSDALASVTLALRPGLELGWLGLALGVGSLLSLPRRKPS